MKKKKGRFLIRAGLMLILAAVLLSAYNIYEAYEAGRAADESMNYLETVLGQPVSRDGVSSDVSLSIPVGSAVPGTEAVQEDEPAAPELPTEVEIPDYQLNPKMEMPVAHYDGQEYIGVLEIPALDLKLPVISQWSYPALKKAPCRYSGSAYTDSMVIAAHNYEAHFGNLNRLNEGAAVIFTDVDGNVFNYRVDAKETLNPQDVDYMLDGGWDLSLFTCTPGGSYRVTIRCVRRISEFAS